MRKTKQRKEGIFLNKSNRDIFLVSIAIFVVGAVLIALGIGRLISNDALYENCTAQTGGVIAGFHEAESTTRDDDSLNYKINYYPIIEYAVNGKTYNFQSTTGYQDGRGGFSVGQEVTVFYDPANPESYYVAELSKDVNSGLIILVCVGGVFLIAGVLAFIRAVKINARSVN